MFSHGKKQTVRLLGMSHFNKELGRTRTIGEQPRNQMRIGVEIRDELQVSHIISVSLS
jgi:hypothetical protein